MDIKGTIKKHGFSISRVADVLGCSQGALSQSIASNPTTNRLREIARVIGCDISEFFEDESANSVVCPHCGKRIVIDIKKSED